MKKTLFLAIFVVIAIFAIATNVQAVDVATSPELKSALESETDEATITLTDNMTLTEKVIISNGKTKTLDLNGKTLTQGSFSIDVENGTLTVKNGKIVADIDALRVVSKGSAILNIEEDVEVTAGDCAVYIRYPGAVLNTAGKLTSTGGGYAAIQGNGSTGSGGVIVNITGGSITSKAEGVYFPNTTELNISGGVITGTTAVYHKSGKLNISGGELIGTGVKAEFVHNPNGSNATGDAIVIEACDYPGGVPVVSITGGTFTSKNNKAIGYYKQTEDYKLANEKFITGGAFSSNVSDYVPAGYVINKVYTYDVDMYEVKLNKPYATQNPVDSSESEFKMGVFSEVQGEVDKIFEKEIEKNETLKKALLDGKLVNVQVQMEKLEEKAIKEEELKAIKEAAKEGKFVEFYDIVLAIIADEEEIDTISEISNKLKFRVFIPEDLLKDGRTFFMYRYHDGKVEKLTGEVIELYDEKYFIFESDKFSTYALAYEDKAEEPSAGGQGTAEQEPVKDETPKTGSVDVVLLASAIVAIISVAGIVTVRKYTK